MQPGKLIVLTGPSGVGKGTLVAALLQRHPQLHLSVSATTRSPRQGEVDGEDYFFLSREAFEAKIAAGDLLEWAEYAGNYYGTPRSYVEQQLEGGDSVLLEIEVMGARQVRDSFPDAIRIFVLPPSFEELESRLRRRGKDEEQTIAERLAIAKQEIATKDEFDYQIVNDDLEATLEDLDRIIASSR